VAPVRSPRFKSSGLSAEGSSDLGRLCHSEERFPPTPAWGKQAFKSRGMSGLLLKKVTGAKQRSSSERFKPFDVRFSPRSPVQSMSAQNGCKPNRVRVYEVVA
jgi:hypothetical protein